MEDVLQRQKQKQSNQVFVCSVCKSRFTDESNQAQVQNCGHFICLGCIEKIAVERDIKCCSRLKIDWQIQQEKIQGEFLQDLVSNQENNNAYKQYLTQSPAVLKQTDLKQLQVGQNPQNERVAQNLNTHQKSYQNVDKISENINLLKLELETEKIQFLQSLEQKILNIENMLKNQQVLQNECLKQMKDNKNNEQMQSQTYLQIQDIIKEISIKQNNQDPSKSGKQIQENENLQREVQKLKQELIGKSKLIEKQVLKLKKKKETITKLEQGLADVKNEINKSKQIQQELNQMNQKEGSQMLFYKEQIEHLNTLISEKQEYILFLENKVEEKVNKINENKNEMEQMEMELKKIKQNEQDFKLQFKSMNSQDKSFREAKLENEVFQQKLQNAEKLIQNADHQIYQLQLQINSLTMQNEALLVQNSKLQQQLNSNDDQLNKNYGHSQLSNDQKFIQIQQKNQSLQEQIQMLINQSQNCNCIKLKEEINDFYEFLIHLMEKVSSYHQKKGIQNSKFLSLDLQFQTEKSYQISQTQKSSNSSRKTNIMIPSLQENISKSFSNQTTPRQQLLSSRRYNEQNQNNSQEKQDFVLCFYKMKRIVLQLIQFSTFSEKLD